MKIVYVAHPISGDIKGNLDRIIKIVRNINLTEPDILPFAHYWIDCHALDDDNELERQRGIKNDIELFNRKIFDELRLYGHYLSRGMKAEVILCRKLNIPVRPMSEKLLNELCEFELSLEKD